MATTLLGVFKLLICNKLVFKILAYKSPKDSYFDEVE